MLLDESLDDYLFYLMLYLYLLNQHYYARCMFATDDKHPNDLLYGGHIDYIIKEAISRGIDPIVAIKVASRRLCSFEIT